MAMTSDRRGVRNAVVRLAVLMAFGLHSLGCAHKTLIRSEPPGASIRVDGKEVGDAPVWIERPYGAFDEIEIQASLKSFEPLKVQVEPDAWFLWPALLATTPFWLVPAIGIPTLGPLLCGAWAIATSPTLCSLALLRKYPEDIVLRMRPKISALDGTVQPTDAWTVPRDYVPNPLPPLPDPKDKPVENPGPKAKETPPGAPPVPPESTVVPH